MGKTKDDYLLKIYILILKHYIDTKKYAGLNIFNIVWYKINELCLWEYNESSF